jgi:hypothetical protein
VSNAHSPSPLRGGRGTIPNTRNRWGGLVPLLNKMHRGGLGPPPSTDTNKHYTTHTHRGATPTPLGRRGGWTPCKRKWQGVAGLDFGPIGAPRLGRPGFG